MSFEHTGVILAGGENTRMKKPKTFLEVGGERVIDLQKRALREVFSELVVVGGAPGDFEGLGMRVVPDDEEFHGLKSPLTGVYTALKETAGNVFVVACDMPFIEPRLMMRLVEMGARHDLVIPRAGGFAEPLFGVYSRSAMGVMKEALLSGERRVQGLFESLDVLFVEEEELRRFDPHLLSFVNVNTPSDLQMAERLAGRLNPAGLCGAMP